MLKAGRTKSCGCYRVDRGKEHGATINLRHGEASNGRETAEYRTWASMLSRCNNPNHVNYPYYGARGISVCDRWKVYENFLADMGRRPSSKHSIDRRDNDGDYTPDNCRWATGKEQNRNTRRNRTVTIDGETKALAQWLEETGTPRRTFYGRLREGMSERDALLTPPRAKNGVPLENPRRR